MYTTRLMITTMAMLLAIAGQSNASLLSSAYELQLETWLGEGNQDFTIIYTKVGGSSSSDFHSATDGVGRTFSLMEITAVEGDTNHTAVGTVIGGYNPQSWKPSGSYYLTPNDADRTAFIYNLTSSLKQSQILSSDPFGDSWGQYQTFNLFSNGPSFGAGYDIYSDSTLSNGSLFQASYGSAANGFDGDKGDNLLGYSWSNPDSNGDWRTYIEYGEIEVYTISSVPEPTSSLACLAMGTIALARRRRRS